MSLAGHADLITEVISFSAGQTFGGVGGVDAVGSRGCALSSGQVGGKTRLANCAEGRVEALQAILLALLAGSSIEDIAIFAESASRLFGGGVKRAISTSRRDGRAQQAVSIDKGEPFQTSFADSGR